MPRQSTVYEVLIASPSDVVEGRTILIEVLEDWNSANSRATNVSLQALRWELDAVPATGERPQQILNKQLVDNADILMAVFWSRLGTPTGHSQSGTVEEIEHFGRQGKPVLLYFSLQDVPHNHDPDQLRTLKEYQKSVASHTFYNTFRNLEELRRHATRDIARVIHDLARRSDPAPPSHEVLSNRNDLATVVLQAQNARRIPGTSVQVTRVLGVIENVSSAKRINEYSCTLSVPSICLGFDNAKQAAEIPSTMAGYRKFRHTEENHRVLLHPGDQRQIVSVEIAVGHLTPEEQERCLGMEVIADAAVNGEPLQVRKTVAELMGITRSKS